MESPTSALIRHMDRRKAVRICLLLIFVFLFARVVLFVREHMASDELPRPRRSPFSSFDMSDYPAAAIDPQSNVTLGEGVFPPHIPESMHGRPLSALYPKGDPHRGEIPSKQMLLLENAPPLVPPPQPIRAPSLPPKSWKIFPWTRKENGSRSSAEDAARPDKQPLAPDWRPAPYDAWAPPLAELMRTPEPVPAVQYAFTHPHRHSGQANDHGRDAMLASRQTMVRNAFVRAWQGYKEHAWGADELRPVSMRPNNNFNGWGATIVDALDTLLVMGLHDEYNLARHHVHDVNFHYVGGERSAYGNSDGRVPVFETAIRYLGGLLSAYDLTGDDLMLDRAEELAQLILPAFETLSGLPVGRMKIDDPANYTAKEPRGHHESVVLAEAGSMLLELTRLWQVTGNRTYFDRVQRVTDYFDRHITKRSRMGTLVSTRVYPESLALSGKYTFGGQADSYYEYLIKEHQLLGGRLAQYPRMYGDAIDSAIEYLIKDVEVVPNAPSLAIITETWGPNARYEPKLEHLGCFAGGMMGLGARLLPHRATDMNVARRLTETCYWAYNGSRTGMGPEEIVFFRPRDTDRYQIKEGKNGTRHRGEAEGFPQTGVRNGFGPHYNRPETIESVFYMWRLTGDPVWQERGWQMFASWMTHSLVTGGVSALGDVHRIPAVHTDSMESFTLAETFKYYYLLFSPPELVSLDDFVFTTEAHPLLTPRKGTYARAGDVPASLLKWTPPPPCEGEAYCGGEGLLRGGLSNAQKHDLYERLRAASTSRGADKQRVTKNPGAVVSTDAIPQSVREKVSELLNQFHATHGPDDAAP